MASQVPTNFPRPGQARPLQPEPCRYSPFSSLIHFPLAQTGEGIKECELIQWFVEVSSGGHPRALLSSVEGVRL